MNPALVVLRRLLPALVVPLLGACGSINVTVDVLNPEYVHTQGLEAALRTSYRDIAKTEAGRFAGHSRRQAASFARELQRLAAEIRKTALRLPPGAQTAVGRSADMLEQGVGEQGSWALQAEATATELEVLAQEVRRQGAALAFDGYGPLPDALRGPLQRFVAVEKDLRSTQFLVVNDARRSLRDRVADAAAAAAAGGAAAARAAGSHEAAAVAAGAAAARAVTVAAAPGLAATDKQADAAASTTARSIIGDGSLASTDYAYTVANAPPALWRPEFNRAYAAAEFGNADMVLRLNSTADFSVKGLMFDASKVAQVASKVLTQTVLVTAQVAGVPVATARTATSGSTASGGEALSQSSADLAGADRSLALREARLTSQRSAIRALAQTLLAAVSSLSSPPLVGQVGQAAGRVGLHTSLDRSFDALRPLIDLQDLP